MCESVDGDGKQQKHVRTKNGTVYNDTYNEALLISNHSWPLNQKMREQKHNCGLSAVNRAQLVNPCLPFGFLSTSASPSRLISTRPARHSLQTIPCSREVLRLALHITFRRVWKLFQTHGFSELEHLCPAGFRTRSRSPSSQFFSNKLVSTAFTLCDHLNHFLLRLSSSLDFQLLGAASGPCLRLFPRRYNPQLGTNCLFR